jgi:hypothetical protein
MFLGAVMTLVSLALWLIFAPIQIEAHMIAMLMSCGFGGLFMYQALSIWTSVLSPRAIPLKVTFGHRLSHSVTVLMMGIFFNFFYLPMILDRVGTDVVLAHWWIAPIVLLVAVSFYTVTLRAGAAVFSRRREIMLSTIERGC